MTLVPAVDRLACRARAGREWPKVAPGTVERDGNVGAMACLRPLIKLHES